MPGPWTLGPISAAGQVGQLRLSPAGGYLVRWTGISYEADGTPTDPRPLFTPSFQLVSPGSGLGPWQAGTWEDAAAATGPWAAVVAIGAGQHSAVNPGTTGSYFLMAVLNGAAENPVVQAGIVILENP